MCVSCAVCHIFFIPETEKFVVSKIAEMNEIKKQGFEGSQKKMIDGDEEKVPLTPTHQKEF